MKTLPSELRKVLERASVQGRKTAETAARQSLTALAVDHHEPLSHLDVQQRQLRSRLRTHARQLGDRRNGQSGAHSIDHLTQEIAYQHWHRMLLLCFLSENALLIEPELQVAVTLVECEDLAQNMGKNKWQLAAEFAHHMLPQVFKPAHLAFRVSLAPEHQRKLEALIEGLPKAVFQSPDAMGWIYQFWQSKSKDRINASEIKIGADELPAVTQLFTEPYMVAFLLENTLGAWCESRYAGSKCTKRLSYLRRLEDRGLAGGGFEDWPDTFAEVKILDPCCGSGHFLVGAFRMLVPMRVEIEGLSVPEAIDAVLAENLFGLEIDPRCVALAAFSLAFAAWTYPGVGGYMKLPPLSIACSGRAPNMSAESWTAIAGNDHAPDSGFDRAQAVRLRGTLEALHGLFLQGPLLGSLIDPSSVGSEIFQSGFAEARHALEPVLRREESEVDFEEGVIVARGLTYAAELLSGEYTLVVTNVPYLGRAKQCEDLRKFCAREYPDAKGDLATVFIQRCLKLCKSGGTIGVVCPQNWLGQSSYTRLRKTLLLEMSWHLVARLGPRCFRSISGAVVNAQLLTLSRRAPASNELSLMDVSAASSPSVKADQLAHADIIQIAQEVQLNNPDHIIASSDISGTLLREWVGAYTGITTTDNFRYRRYFWELSDFADNWKLFQGTVRKTIYFGGREKMVRWLRGTKVVFQELPRANFSGNAMWGKAGISVSQMRSLPVTIYTGEPFDNNCSAVGPADADLLMAIWCFCSSPEYNTAIRLLDQALKVTNATLAKVPFDYERWAQIAREQYPDGLPDPYSDDPTQWVFHGHPCGSVVWCAREKRLVHGPVRRNREVLHTAMARLLGFRWPAEQDSAMNLASLQRSWVNKAAALNGLADADGIVCIPSVRGEPSAEQRLLEMLAHAYGQSWGSAILAQLLESAGCTTLGDWLRNHFFEQHCRLFHHRPFIWHIWDGRKRDGFHALVNYHRLAAPNGRGRQTLESLTYSYLGDWISRRKHDLQNGKEAAEDRLAAAVRLQTHLTAILKGDPPDDIFVRWKPLHQQAIGWEPDLDDGVRLNIRPLMAQDIDGGRKGAGVLRSKPTISWKKDRGKEAKCNEADFPWFWDNGRFTANRINNVHLTSAEKTAAREQEATPVTTRTPTIL
ncbi:MAG: N-6 DNA methylase [Bacteroidota bacterium]|nr:N-6 DNA methylase [Bacteroidota bacterium]